MNLEDAKTGQPVLYVPNHAQNDVNHHDCERGIVTSKNDKFIFVDFEGCSYAKACYPRNLIPG